MPSVQLFWAEIKRKYKFMTTAYANNINTNGEKENKMKYIKSFNVRCTNLTEGRNSKAHYWDTEHLKDFVKILDLLNHSVCLVLT